MNLYFYWLSIFLFLLLPHFHTLLAILRYLDNNDNCILFAAGIYVYKYSLINIKKICIFVFIFLLTKYSYFCCCHISKCCLQFCAVLNITKNVFYLQQVFNLCLQIHITQKKINLNMYMSIYISISIDSVFLFSVVATFPNVSCNSRLSWI